MLWEDFVRYTRRFGWSLDRTRDQFRLNRFGSGSVRERFTQHFPDAYDEVPDNWSFDNLENIEFDATDYTETYEDIGDTEINNPFDEAPSELPATETTIDIELAEFGEATPLLGPGAGAAGAGAGAGAGSSAATAAAAAAAAAATAAAIGAGIGGAFANWGNNDDRPPVTLPDHNYLGPGNPHDSGLTPVDIDDQISAQHDLEYAKSQTEQDILKADAKAQHDFESDAIDTGNPHSVLGALGLKIKTEIEKKIGVQYPKLPDANKGTFLFPEWFENHQILDQVGLRSLLMTKYFHGLNIIEHCIGLNMYIKHFLMIQ